MWTLQAPTDTSCENKSMVSGSEQRTDGTDGTKTTTAMSISAHPQHQGLEQVRAKTGTGAKEGRYQEKKNPKKKRKEKEKKKEH